MKIYNKKSYFAPVADIVIIDNNDDLLGGDFQFASFCEGTDGEEAGAKGTRGFEDYSNPIFDVIPD